MNFLGTYHLFIFTLSKDEDVNCTHKCCLLCQVWWTLLSRWCGSSPCWSCRSRTRATTRRSTRPPNEPALSPPLGTVPTSSCQSCCRLVDPRRSGSYARRHYSPRSLTRIQPWGSNASFRSTIACVIMNSLMYLPTSFILTIAAVGMSRSVVQVRPFTEFKYLSSIP